MFYKKNKKLESQLYTKMHATLLAIIDTLKSLFDGLLAWLLSIFSSNSGLTLRFRSRTVLYRKADVLGEGAYGTVVKGQDRLSSKKYAIKIMNCPNYEVESVINNEIESLNKFKHKNIIELIDSHSAVDNGGQKVVFLLFPLCSGGSLRSYLNSIVDDGNSKQPLKNILKDFNKICSAVGSLHDYSPSHIHQDIKPDNILIQDGIPILTDFGSVRLAHREVSTRQQALAIIDESAQFCTMPYRAPELFEPTRGVNLDCRTDVWSVGCLLFAWWFGYSPFECEFTASESKSCKYRVKLAECSFSRVLARIPRPSGKEVNIDDNIVCDLVEWILEKNISTRPFMSDVISRIEETIGNMQDSNNAL